MHGLGKDAALLMVTKVLRQLTDEEIEEVQNPRKKTDPQTVVLTGRLDRSIVGRLRAPNRVRAQIAAGQIELPLLPYPAEPTRLRRPRRFARA
jgi:hypothetical protein